MLELILPLRCYLALGEFVLMGNRPEESDRGFHLTHAFTICIQNEVDCYFLCDVYCRYKILQKELSVCEKLKHARHTMLCPIGLITTCDENGCIFYVNWMDACGKCCHLSAMVTLFVIGPHSLTVAPLIIYPPLAQRHYKLKIESCGVI